MEKYMRNTILFVKVIFIGFLLSSCYAMQATPAPTPTPRPERLTAPGMPEKNPSQADHGAQVYYQVCMACHGDMGQGLTDEWRAIWQEDSNCWQPECHGPDHPSHGFQIEKTCCPAVFGENTLARFDNAQELFIYNSEQMPWWNPGYLTKEEFWQVTAYMIRTHGAMPDEVTLDEGNASIFYLRPEKPLPGDRRPDIWFVSGILTLVAGLLLFQGQLKR